MSIDEELNQLDNDLRKLKIEYDVFFGGGSKKPPLEIEGRVQNGIKRYLDGSKLSNAQRFRLQSISQKYSSNSAVWQRKVKIRDEGFRRPQDAALGIVGMRTEQEHAAAAALSGEGPEEAPQAFTTHIGDVGAEHDKVQALYNAMIEARKKAGDNSAAASLDSFKAFVQKKTDQIRKDYACKAVEYEVAVEKGQVKLKAKAKK